MATVTAAKMKGNERLCVMPVKAGIQNDGGTA
jgi:hypothetical protein